MATYINNLRLKEITTGDEDGTWGTSTNTNLELITDGFSFGTKEIAADANETFTMPDATADATRSLYLKFTSAVSLTATREITLGPNTVSKTWIIENATTGGQVITIKQGSGATVNVANGEKVMIVTDGAGAGAAVLNANPTAATNGTVTSVAGTGTVNGITLTGTVTTTGSLTLGGALSGVDLTTQVTGTLPIANGGTGSTSTTFANLTTNVTGTLPIANGGTGLTTYTTGDIVYASATDTLSKLTLGSADQVLKVNSGGTQVEWAEAVDGAWEFLSSASSSGAYTVQFDWVGNSGYSAYVIQFIGLTNKRTGGASPELSGYTMYGATPTALVNGYNSVSAFYNSTSFGTSTGGVRCPSITGGNIYNGYLYIFNPESTSINEKSVSVRFNNALASPPVYSTSAHSSNTDAITGFQFSLYGGYPGYDGIMGNFKLYGVKSS